MPDDIGCFGDLQIQQQRAIQRPEGGVPSAMVWSPHTIARWIAGSETARIDRSNKNELLKAEADVSTTIANHQARRLQAQFREHARRLQAVDAAMVMSSRRASWVHDCMSQRMSKHFAPAAPHDQAACDSPARVDTNSPARMDATAAFSASALTAITLTADIPAAAFATHHWPPRRLAASLSAFTLTASDHIAANTTTAAIAILTIECRCPKP